MRVFLRVLVGATIVADTVGLILYGAVVRLQGDTILQDALVIAGAIAFAVVLLLALAAIESRGRPRRKRTTAKAATPAPTPQRVAAPPLRPIRPNVIGASEAPIAAQPVPKAPAPAPVVPTPVVAARSVSAPAPSATPALVPAARIAPTNVSPAPALATRLAPMSPLASRIASAPVAPSQVVREIPRATETIPAPMLAPEPIAPATAPELEWVVPAELGGPVEPQPFFELPVAAPEIPASFATPTPEPAPIEPPAEAPVIEIAVPAVVAEIAVAEAAVAEVMTQPPAETADLARWREQAVSLVIPQAPRPPATEPEARIPELDAIVRALDALRAAEAPEPPRLVVIDGGRTRRSAAS